MTVVGADRAVPGSEEAAIVSVTSHAGVSPVRLIIRVGAAPSDAPAGRVAHPAVQPGLGRLLRRSPSSAPSGEVNPLPRTPLEVIEVAACRRVRRGDLRGRVGDIRHRHVGPRCPGRHLRGRRSRCATRRAAARTPSGTDSCCSTCSATRRRRRASRRAPTPTAASRCAWIPARRARPTRRSPDSSSGRAARSSPSAPPTGCVPRSRRPMASAANYEAFAVNAVGESLTSVTTTAWAYDPPPAPSSVLTRPVVTGGEGGVIAMRIDGIEPDETGSVEITSATGETVRVPVGPRQTSARRPVVPRRDEHVDAGDRDAVLALRRAAGTRRQRVRRGRRRCRRTASERRWRSTCS